MAQTQTQTIQRHGFVSEARAHDYLYDPVHTLSSLRDHARATFKAHTSGERLQRVPAHVDMFSDLRNHPRLQLRINHSDPVPKFVNRQWRGHADQAREALIRYKKFNYDPSVEVPVKQFESAEVSGQNRALFFRRPIIPFMQQVPPDVVLAANRPDLYLSGQFGPGEGQRPETPLMRTVACQTDYRDGEAQTDPYTPEYVLNPGEQPEVLTLATLSWKRGLPAGMAEVEMIERARFKRAWEASLPPLNDMSQLDKRRRMMDEMERYEWALREQEIEKLQEARLEVLLQLLRKREDNHEQLNNRRLDRLWSRKQKEKEEKFKRIRYEHIKIIRKLTKKRSNVEGKLHRRDIINDYADPSSQAFAPQTRVGVFLDRGSEQFVVRNRFLSTYDGLCELESTLPEFVLQPRVRVPKPKTVTSAGFTKRKYRREQELEEFHDYIKEQKRLEGQPKKPLRFLEKIEKPIPRPATPSVSVPSDEEERRELAVIFLQQLVRGRAIQSLMFEGKEKRKELIKELRSTHALQRQEQLIKKEEQLATMGLQRQRRLHQHREDAVNENLDELQSETLGDMSDFLSKELVRLQEERRIHAFSMLAERRRRLREAEESGSRQVEERRRREEDEIFKQLVKCQQDTVDTYLEDVILSSAENAADSIARQDISKLANTLNDIAYEAENRRDQLETEEMVSELVHQFLIPEVHKQTARERLHQGQRHFLLAAHKEVHGASEKMHPKIRVDSPREDKGTSN